MLENITETIKYIGVNDRNIDLFESQYIVPNGMSYNSYLIKDENNVVMDTVDCRVTEAWLNNLEKELDGEKVDYLVISHLEPDHSANIATLCKKYPEMKIIGNNKTFIYLPQFCDIKDLDNRKVEVKEGDKISFGKHTLKFFMAPMVHWPEVMVSYESSEKVLFSADAFGKFGCQDVKDNWVDEARRFYINIVAKYGLQVQALLNKLSGLDIKFICSLHGPVLSENLSLYIDKYNIWSKYEPEEEGVLVAYASIHGNTAKVAKEFAKILDEKIFKNIVLFDLTRQDMSEAISLAYKYDKLVVAASSYNAGVFPPMEQFLKLLKDKNYQNRKVGIIENGTWAPSAAKSMKALLDEMKNITQVEPIVTIKTTLKLENIEQLNALAEALK